MKNKAFTIFSVSWFILLFLFLSFIAYFIFDIENENNLVEQLAKQNTAKEDIILSQKNANNPIVLEGKIEEHIIDYAATYYYALPETVRNEVQNTGWKLVLTDKDISKTYYNGPVKGRLAGLTDCMNKKIYIYAARKDIRRAMIHEFGHFFDYSHNFISLNPSFEKIYNKEKGAFKEKRKTDSHATSNEMEYFAEAFSQLILYPDLLKNNCPSTYDYMKNLLDSYCSSSSQSE